MERQPSKHEAQQEQGKPMVDHAQLQRHTAADHNDTDTTTTDQAKSTVSEAQSVTKSASEVPHLNDDVAGSLVKSFKLLADETRLRILFFLMHRKELNVRSLCELLHQSQPAVSHHLALLRNAELIDSRRDGKHNFYHLTPAKFQKIIDTLATAAPGMPSEIRFSDYVQIPSDA